jgi:diacylglycerol O-acyltransferase / wax synthase
MGYDRLSGLDTAFLCLDSPAAPMNLGALAVFNPLQPVHPPRLVELLRDRAARIPRLRRRPRTMLVPFGAVQWAPDPEFLVERHVFAHHLRHPHDPDQLTDKVSELMSQRLDTDRPLWELHVITGLAGGRFALLAKLHHALADGAGAVMIGLSLMDGFTHPPAVDESIPGPFAGVTDAVTDAARRGARLVNDSAAALAAIPEQARRVCGAIPEQARRVRESLDIAAAVVRGARPPEPTSPLLTAPSRERQLATLRIALSEIKRVRAYYGGTTNDVLLAILSGALREWLLTRGEEVDGRTIRILVPVNQRSRSGTADTGSNQLSGYLCDLPIGEPDPVARLQAVRDAMDRNKEAGPFRGATAGRAAPTGHSVRRRWRGPAVRPGGDQCSAAEHHADLRWRPDRGDLPDRPAGRRARAGRRVLRLRRVCPHRTTRQPGRPSRPRHDRQGVPRRPWRPPGERADS